MKITTPIILAIIAAIIIGSQFLITYGTQDTVTAKVIKTERIMYMDKNNANSKYLIFCENETFENVDSLLYFKFNSSDIYGHILAGGTYKFRVYGIRIPFFSYYRNIISAELVR